MLRPARTEDLELLVEGNRAMAEETEGLALDLERLRPGVAAVLADPARGTYFIWEVEGRAVAQLLVTYEWSDWRNAWVWWIQSVFVAPEHRRRGYYRSLYEAVKARAQAEDAAGLRLYVERENTRAQSTYAALGMDGEHYRLFEAMFTEH